VSPALSPVILQRATTHNLDVRCVINVRRRAINVRGRAINVRSVRVGALRPAR
jgi:hypothetical protein